jgi:hypothetical protein
MNIFQYPHLDASQKQIRLLRPLQPTVAREPEESVTETSSSNDILVQPNLTLEFELVVVSLYENPIYTALSYVWGTVSTQTSSISVNGQRFHITQNLDIALRHLQYEDIAPAIWIDSICINQQDYNEKTEQVGQMSSIFSKASHVLVWLGPARDNSDLVATVIHEFANQIRRHCNVPTPQKYDLLDYFDFESENQVNSLLETAIRTSGLSDQTTAKDFPNTCLKCIIGIPWWYRVWVIQEFVLSRKVLFQVGSRKIQLEELSAAIMISVVFTVASTFVQPIIKGMGRLGGAAGYDWVSYMLVHRERHTRNRKSVRDFYELLVTTYSRPPWSRAIVSLGASNRADYIFGLVGLAKEHFTQLGLEIDYRKPWQDIYTDVAQALITAGYMDLFAFCQNPGPNDSYNLPSWVPNWQARIQIPNGWFKSVPTGRHSLLGHSLFSASGSSTVRATFARTFVDEWSVRSMTLSGVLVDKVLEAKTVYARSTVTRVAERELLYGNLFREIELLCAQSKTLGPALYPPTILSEAIWRMPIWDHELEDDEQGDGEALRATRKSHTRWKKCLNLFQAVEAYTLAERFSQRPVGTTPIQSSMRWVRSMFYSIVSKYFLLRFNMPSASRIWECVKAPSKIWRRADLLNTGNDPTVDANIYLLAMECGRPIRTFITQQGYIGIGPATMKAGDSVCIYFGARVPHILRPRSDNGYTFIGEAYVHGIMDGELMTEDQESEEFEIF